MSEIIIAAQSLGTTARAVLRNGAQIGAVLSVHRDAVNFTLAGEPALFLVDSALGNHPAAVVVDAGPLDAFGLDPGEPAAFDGSLRLGRRVTVDLGRAALWSPTLLPPGGVAGAVTLGKRVAAAGRLCAARPRGGLSGLHARREGIVAGRLGWEDAGDEAVHRAAFSLSAGIRALLRGDTAAVVAALSQIVGLGPGLTPSGDDVLAGLLGSLVQVTRAGGGPATAARAGTELAAFARGRTNPVAEAYLAHACRGELSEVAGDFVHALIAGRGDEWAPALARLLDFGASSGSEIALGILLGADVWARMV